MQHYVKAKLAEKHGNFEEAIQGFSTALKLDPTFFNALYSKALCENMLGRFEDAIETYSIAF